MNNKSKQETKEEAIVRLYNADESIGAIRRITGAKLDRVEYTINYYKKNEQVPAPKRSGQPPKSTPEVLKGISTMTTNNHMMSCSDISDRLKNDKVGNCI